MTTRKTVEIPYRPRKLQEHIHNNLSRFNVVVTHRRFGKTVFAVNELIKSAMTTDVDKARYAYIAPQLKQAKSVAWDTYFKKYASPIPDVSFNEAELRIDFPNGARIDLLGADNPNQLRGIGLDGVVFDEYALIDPTVWPEIIYPTLVDRNGWAIFMGTPKGKNHFYDMKEKAEDKDEDDWSLFQYPVSKTNIISDEQIEELWRKVETGEMELAQYRQEWECSFSDAIRGAYYAKQIEHLKDNGQITDVPYNGDMPVFTAWDIGTGDSCTIGFIQKIGQNYHFIDSYSNNDYGVQHYADVLHQKPYSYQDHLAPWDVNSREFGTGQSVKETAQNFGIIFNVVPKLDIEDGIQAVRNILPQCLFDRNNCEKLIRALEEYQKEWDQTKQRFKDDPLHDWTSHWADMVRYFAVGINHVKGSNNTWDSNKTYTADDGFSVF